ncbi:MAG TPA: hypothetical protein VFZ41_06020, partial [Solirubrobacterales bacterium]
MKLRVSSYALVAALLLGAATVADAALVRVGRVVVRADGGFTPQTLPRKKYAPISFQGQADIESTDGGPPPKLVRARLDFDRDGRLSTRGLPVCIPSRIENAAPKAARRICGKALVGTGEVAASISLPGLSGARLRSPLSVFNGPRVNGHPSVVGHAWTTFPKREVFVTVIPIERRGGPYSYTASVEIPEIAEGGGALTHLNARIGRR